MGLGGDLFLRGGGLWYGRCVWSLWERKLQQDQYILYADFQRSVTCVRGNESSGGYLSYYGFDMNLAPGPCRMWWMHYLIFLSLLTLKGNSQPICVCVCECVCLCMHVYPHASVCACVCMWACLWSWPLRFYLILLKCTCRSERHCQVDFHCSNLGAIMGVYEHTHAHKRTNTHTHTHSLKLYTQSQVARRKTLSA